MNSGDWASRLRLYVLHACVIGLLFATPATPSRAESPSDSNEASAHGVLRTHMPKSPIPIGAVHPVQIHSSNPFYSPSIIDIDVGDVIEWQNPATSDVHTVYGKKGDFVSPQIAPGSRWCHQFIEEGEYDYTCRIHPWMHGGVRVHPKMLPVAELTLPGGPSGDKSLLHVQEGRLWVRDGGRLELLRVTPGMKLELLRTLQLPGLPAVVFDASGNGWFRGSAMGTLAKMSPKDAAIHIVRVGVGSRLVPLAFDPAGRLWALDKLHSILFAIDGNGKTAMRIALKTTVDGTAAAFSAGGDGWLAANHNRALVRIDSQAGSSAEHAIPEGARIDSLQPYGTAVWAVDAGRTKLLKFEGDWTTAYTLPSKEGRLSDPQPDAKGWIWFTEKAAGKIAALRRDGGFSQYQLPVAIGRPTSLRIDEAGNLWVLGDKGNRIAIVANATLRELGGEGILVDSACKMPAAASMPAQSAPTGATLKPEGR